MASLLALAARRRLAAERRVGPDKAALACSTTRGLGYRDFATDPEFCGLTLPPLVAAIMDASEGRRPTTIDDETCRRHFGCGLDALPKVARRTVVTRAGGRGGKTSRLIATKALHAAWTVPLPTLRHGEHAAALIVAPDLTLAGQALNFVKGYIDASPRLRAARVGDGDSQHVTLRRPDGKLVDVRVRAAGKGGKGGRAFTLVFAALDEACFFYDEGSGVINDVDIYRAVIQRIVPEGQVWIASTPWIDGVGLLEDRMSKDFGVHEHSLCVQAPTRALNPTWDPDGTIEADMRENDPDNAAREIDAIPLASGAATFLSADAIRDAIDDRRAMTLPRLSGYVCAAGGDLAFRRNSSALAIVRRLTRGTAPSDPETDCIELLALEELRPERGHPLDPAAVVEHFAGILTEYQCADVCVDTHERDDAQLALATHGLSAVPFPEGQPGKVEAFVLFRRLLHAGRIVLPNHVRLRAQLRTVSARPQPGGGMSITQRTGADGAHGDLVSALVAAVWNALHPTAHVAPRARMLRTPAAVGPWG